MNEGRTVFAQLLDFLPKYEFDKCVARYHGNFRVRKLPTYEQFLVLAFAQLTWRESLRDIETCLSGRVQKEKGGSSKGESGFPPSFWVRGGSRIHRHSH